MESRYGVLAHVWLPIQFVAVTLKRSFQVSKLQFRHVSLIWDWKGGKDVCGSSETQLETYFLLYFFVVPFIDQSI